jgi:hypothetical protein
MQHTSRCVIVAIVSLLPSSARTDHQGEWIDTDMVGIDAYTHNFSEHTNTNIGSTQDLSDFVGLHYYVADHLRVGVTLQFTERLAPAPAGGIGRFQTFALLPQIGWNFSRSFYAALAGSLAPWTSGKDLFDAGFQGLIGASTAFTPSIRGNVALEIPVNFVQATTVGVTMLAGLSISL